MIYNVRRCYCHWKPFSGSLLYNGLHQWWKSRGKDNEDFLMGGGKMSPIPVAISLFAGIVSAITILGNPSEMYFYGSQLWMNVIGMLLGVTLASLIIVPVLYPLKIVSMYEVLELRWRSTAIRKLATILQLLNFLTYLGIALYAPSLALSSVTPVPTYLSVAVMGIVCTTYASLGGAKAVVYVDTVQAFIMIAGVIAVVAQGCYEVGGAASSWQINKEGGRIDFFNLSTDPLERHTLMSTLILGIYYALGSYGTSQQHFQRWASVATIKQAYLVIIVSVVTLVSVTSLVNYSGLVVFSVYADCDPYTMGIIDKIDQITVYFVVDKLGYLPGMAGLFVAAVYSGVLSTVSSTLNAMAAMIWEDLLKNLSIFSDFNSGKAKKVTILISIISGAVSVLLGLLAGSIGGLFQISYSIGGAIGGPIAGLIITAVMCPWVKSVSAIVGLLCSITLTMWMVVGDFLYAPAAPMLPLSTEGCPGNNITSTTVPSTDFTTIFSTLTTEDREGDTDVFPLYLVTYCFYGSIGLLTTLFAANLSMLIFGAEDIHDFPKNTVLECSLRFQRWISSMGSRASSLSGSRNTSASKGSFMETGTWKNTESDNKQEAIKHSSISDGESKHFKRGSVVYEVNMAFEAEEKL